MASQTRPHSSGARACRRPGFSLIELLVVVVVAGILLTISGVSIGRQIARDRVVRSASVVEGMLAEAGQTAVRRREPITLTLSGSTLQINRRQPLTVLRSRNFGPGFDLRATLTMNPSTGITIFPSGRADQAVSITVSGSGVSHTITRTATGILGRQ